MSRPEHGREDIAASEEPPRPEAGVPDSAYGESGIEVEVHAHFGMTGSFPLRMAELFFASDGLHIAEYGLITPMFGLGTRKHRREAATMAAVLDRYGIDETLARADAVTWLSYDVVERVVLSDGGWLGKPRVGVYAADGATYAYRIHDESFDPEAFEVELSAFGAARGFDVVLEAGLGYRPTESVRRFFR